MKCKKCKHEIADNSIFCNWCGHKQLTASDDVRVPVPRKKGNKFVSQIMVGEERIFISANSEEEYYAKARAAKTEQIEIKKTSPKGSLGKVIDNYISSVDSVLSPSTIKSYKSYRNNRFQNYIKIDISKINFQRMVNEEAKEVKPKTLANAWRLVTASLRHAKFDIPQVNLPMIPHAERPWLDYQQIEIFLQAIRGEKCELAALLALNGLRRSELLHLTDADVDVDKGLIYVRGASVYNDKGQFVNKETNKNATSARIVHIVIPRLTELLRCKTGVLITTKPNTTYVQVNRICRDVGLPEIGVHGLRHSYVSLGRHLKMDALTIKREGGWADLDTVNKIYTHLAAQDADNDVKIMSEFYTTTNCNHTKEVAETKPKMQPNP